MYKPILILFLIALSLPLAAEPAPFVWLNDSATGRMVYALFRNSVELETVPQQAEIHLYADSRYHLMVNGTFVNFGPLRAYPQHPYYDTYDIIPYLKPGENVIAVKVLSNGMNTFQLPYSIGGFSAWGEIRDNGRAYRLDTPGSWRCARSKAYDPTAPKMSFAAGPIEVVDGRKQLTGWTEPGFDASDWQKPVAVRDQDHWGTLKPRYLPHLTQNMVTPKHLVKSAALSVAEDIYSFRIKLPDRTRRDTGADNWLYGYTYIYSPREQEVQAGLWWGEYWLNGVDVKPEFDKIGRNNHTLTPLPLKKGWNFFFMEYKVFQALWDFYMAVPDSADLVFSPTRQANSANIFMTAGPVPTRTDTLGMAGKAEIPYQSHQDLPDFLGPWQGQKRSSTAGNPAWDMAWRLPEHDLNFPSHQVSDITLTDESALVFDMGGKILGRIFIEYDAPVGTNIDIGFAEDLTRDSLASVLKRPGIYTATRHISGGGPQRHETFKPYGARYLQVNVTGNSGPVTIKRLGMVSQIYPFEKIGSFTCSDPMFNAIWELGWRTLQVCSEDTYTDTPFRERGLYAGDALPQFAITLAGSGDPGLIKYSLEVFQDKYRGMFDPDKDKSEDEPGLLYDFPFITLEYFRWYVDWSGDIEFAAELYDNYRYMVENAVDKQQENGLFANLPAFVEWTRIDKRAQLTMMQSLLARSFENMAHLAAKLRKSADVQRYKELQKETVQAITRLCWDEERGAYRDGFKNGEPIDHHYPISSAWMSLSGYNSKERETELTDFYRTELADIGEISRARKVTPYGGFYVLGALYRHNRADIAETFIRQYWTRMILNHNDTAWENFDDGSGPSSGQGTLSHAWSGGPTYYMTTDILGVRLGFPYFYSPDTVRIEPLAESISWAQGTVPHPDGVVEVQWRIKGDQLFLNYTAPEGVTCIIKPRGRLADKPLWINGLLAD